MKVVVFGATGRTGRHVVELALDEGHDVVAVTRRPEAMRSRERLENKRSDVLDPCGVAAAMSGADVLICTIGPASDRNPGTLLSAGIRNLVSGCAISDVNRFVFQSGIMVSDGDELTKAGHLAVTIAGFVRSRLRAEKVRAEAILSASPIEWVIVRPPRLKQTPATGDYVAAPAARIAPAKAIAYADCAAALLIAAKQSKWTRQIVNVGRA